MTFVITGASSFLGISLCQQLSQSNHLVYAICRKKSSNLQKLPLFSNIKLISCDISSIEMICGLINKADIFINLAWAGSGQKERDDASIHMKNIGNTLQAIKVAKKIGCKMFVETGSQAEYGFCNGIIDEETKCNPITEYGKAKLAVCNLGFSLSKEIGIQYIHLRIFSVYGEHDHDYTLINTCLRKMLNNTSIELSACTQKWNFLYVKDAVLIITRLIQVLYNSSDMKNYIFNIASLDTRPLKFFIEEMKEITESSSLLLYDTHQSLSLLNLEPSTKKVLALIGDVNFTGFHTGIDKTIKYLVNQ